MIVLADDVALISTSPTELQEMLDITHEYTKTWRYRINPNKSKIVIFNQKARKGMDHHSWRLGEEPVDTADQYPHLGITKSTSKLDPTDNILNKGTRAFYAMTGAGAYTGGLLPHHSAHLWKTYCIPRMLYGAPVMKFTQTMKTKLDRAQHQLFKKILGLPNSADEAVYLLTGLAPLSTQVDMEILLLVGQLVTLPRTRYEVRTLLHAVANSTPLLQCWNDTLRRYQLPDLQTAITDPIPYNSWKSAAKRAITASIQQNTHKAVESKSSLSFFKGSSLQALDLYPPSCSSPFLRQAVIIRAQLVTNTYLTQIRLNQIKKTATRHCQLCSGGDEDTVHLVAQCPFHQNARLNLLSDLRSRSLPQQALTVFNLDNPHSFTQAVLLPNRVQVDATHRHILITKTLTYLYHIHASRAAALLRASST